MHGDLARLRSSFDSLLDSWRSMAPFGTGESAADELEAAEDADVLDLLQAIALHQHRLEALAAAAAREVDRRSDPVRGEAALARRHGCRNGRDLVAEVMHVASGEAGALARVGAAIVGDRGLSGERVPASDEHVADALRRGEIGLAHSNEIVMMTKRLAPRVDSEALREGERELVGVARTGMRLADFRKVCRRLEAHLDPDGLEPELDRQRRHRGLTFRTSAQTGMLHVNGRFDTESGAYIVHALQSYTTSQLRTARGRNRPGDPDAPETGERTMRGSMPDNTDAGPRADARPDAHSDARPDADARAGAPTSNVHFAPTAPERTGEVAADTRSLAQLQADALVEFCKHGLACDHSEVPGPSTAVVVRVDARDLERAEASARADRRLDDEAAEVAAATGVPSVVARMKNGRPARDAVVRAVPADAAQPLDAPQPGRAARSAGAAQPLDAPQPGRAARSAGAARVDSPIGAEDTAAPVGATSAVGAADTAAVDETARADSAVGPHNRVGSAGAAELRGFADIDGGTVIDAGAARRLAAHADLIPVVLGTDSEVLDLGRAHRHFTRAQRIALAERDGGCAFCGLPPGMTEAHHIDWWYADHGKTDLDNGVLLCTSCHHRIHEGWQVRVVHPPELPSASAPPGGRSKTARPDAARPDAARPDAAPPDAVPPDSRTDRTLSGEPPKRRGGGTVWFIPPSDIDWRRTPRLGGRKRFDVAYRRAHPPTPIPGFE
ncbi:HNH nuclease [Gulosibacter sp. 10]|nr:HNH nuclease [Gulosibacter sp. 10]